MIIYWSNSFNHSFQDGYGLGFLTNYDCLQRFGGVSPTGGCQLFAILGVG